MITNRCGSKNKQRIGAEICTTCIINLEKDELLSWHAFSKRTDPPNDLSRITERKRGYTGEKRGKTSNGYPRTRFISSAKKHRVPRLFRKSFRVNRIYVRFLDLYDIQLSFLLSTNFNHLHKSPYRLQIFEGKFSSLKYHIGNGDINTRETIRLISTSLRKSIYR